MAVLREQGRLPGPAASPGVEQPRGQGRASRRGRGRTGFGGGDDVDLRLRAHTVKRGGGLAGGHVPRRELFSIPLTQAGAVYLDEDSKAYRMYIIDLLAQLTRHDLKLSGYPSYAQITQANPRIAGTLVVLAGSGDSPPSGPLRLLQRRARAHGGGHIRLRSAAVHRALGRDVLSTNVAGFPFR